MIGDVLDALRLGGKGSGTGESGTTVTTVGGPTSSGGGMDEGGNRTSNETDGFGMDGS